MTSISCENIKVSFGVDTILENVSFSLNDGDRLGIVGVNGAGKTTLFKIITGEYTQTDGSVYIAKNKKIGILSQEEEFDEQGTVYGEMIKAKSKFTFKEIKKCQTLKFITSRIAIFQSLTEKQLQ